jgi:uncharacterized cupredoxin-like copper-binding protein
MTDIRKRRRPARRLIPCVALGLALAAAGCGLATRRAPTRPAPTTPAPATPAPKPGAGGAATYPTPAGAAATPGATGVDTGAGYAQYYRANGTATAEAGQALKIEMTEFKFTPNTIAATRGRTVRIELVNKGAVTHNLSLDAFKVNATLPPGHSTTVTFTPDRAGTYYFYCNVPGHVQAGMVRKLTVR